jgi:hypothetical protein
MTRCSIMVLARTSHQDRGSWRRIRVRRRRSGAKVIAVAMTWPLPHILVLSGISTSCTKVKSKHTDTKTSQNRDRPKIGTVCKGSNLHNRLFFHLIAIFSGRLVRNAG